MASIRTKLIKKIVTRFFSGWHLGTIQQQRAKQKKMARFNFIPRGISTRPVSIKAIEAVWVSPEKPAGAILYLHGGAYTLGSIQTHRSLSAHLAKAANLQVLLVDYRLAPESPFPAGLEDALTAYDWLLGSGISPANLLIAGDSAGGGLALAALLKIRDSGLPLPAGGILLSPWTDLTLSGESVTTKAKTEIVLNPEHLKVMAELYAGNHDLRNPLISPVFADLHHLPALLIQVGTDEILLDDALRLARFAREANLQVQLEIYDKMFHLFHMFPFFKETRLAFQSMADFCHSVTNSPPDLHP